MKNFEKYKSGTKKTTAQSLNKNAKLIKSSQLVLKHNRKRLVVAFFILAVMMVLLLIRVGYWQIIRADELQEKALSMQTADVQIEPMRGSIYDSKMNVLAENVKEYELYGYTQYLYKDKKISDVKKELTVSELSKLTGEEENDIRTKLNGKENFVLLADGLTKEQVQTAEKKWEGSVAVKTKNARYYPNGSFASHVLGGVNTDIVGRTGLEYEYNDVLSGVKGRTLRTTDRDGSTVAGGKTKIYKAKDGNSIVTTIDALIQHYVEDAIKRGKKETGAAKVTCIVTNPKTGDVLALASTENYDPNNSERPLDKSEYAKFKSLSDKKKTEYLSKMWTVDAISTVYEPGSTFKLITAAAGLESGNADENSRYYCNGTIRVSNQSLHCVGHHGTQSLKVAVGNSCNPALAKLALDMGGKTFYNYIDLFGFNDRTGIDLPGETDSIVKDADTIGAVDLATTGYGHGIAITPIQIISAVNALGNDGILMKPKLVKKIIDKDGKTIKKVKDTEVRQVVSSETAAKMCDIMQYYVSDAGGTGAYVPGFRVGGKTGTANIVSGNSYSDATNTSFVAMAPMDDPQISMICIVYRPTKKQYGNNTAGPIVKEIMEKSLPYLGVERDKKDTGKSKDAKGITKVPGVSGKDSKKAIEEIKKAGLDYEVLPASSANQSFLVVDQYPKSGTKVEKGTKVFIYSE